MNNCDKCDVGLPDCCDRFSNNMILFYKDMINYYESEKRLYTKVVAVKHLYRFVLHFPIYKECDGQDYQQYMSKVLEFHLKIEDKNGQRKTVG